MILLMAGTSEGRELACWLQKKGYELVVTTVSEYGASLLAEGIECIHRPLGVEELTEVIRERDVQVLIDGTHPFAVEASRNGREAVARTGIRYLRWDREDVEGVEEEQSGEPYIPLVSGQVEKQGDGVGMCDEIGDRREMVKNVGSKVQGLGMDLRFVRSIQEVIQHVQPFSRILLTVGSKELSAYARLIQDPEKQVYARVLPLPQSMEICWQVGLPAGQMIAAQGPFSVEWNLAMLRQYQIEVLVSKESGRRGGVDAKLQAAAECGIPAVLIRRPEVAQEGRMRSRGELEEILAQVYGDRK